MATVKVGMSAFWLRHATGLYACTIDVLTLTRKMTSLTTGMLATTKRLAACQTTTNILFEARLILQSLFTAHAGL